MANVNTRKKTIGILTGGGDVPGLNPAIRALTIRAIREGYRVFGIRRGWAGLVELIREVKSPLDEYVIELTEDLVNKIGRTGGTFLHSSRTRPSTIPQSALPEFLKTSYPDNPADVTKEVLANLNWLGIDILVPIGGDDTLSYGARLHKEGVPVIAIPKTMDNDVPGTDYCIGFSTCVTRTIEFTHALRTCAGSHERFLVIEVFGRYAGFTALLPTMAGAANRCVIPEHVFDIKRLCELLVEDRYKNPSKYSVVLVSEGATFKNYLFSIDLEYVQHLAQGTVGEDLLHEFQAKGYKLSEHAVVENRNDKQWVIDDTHNQRRYLATQEIDKIEIASIDMVFEGTEADMFGHKKLGGIGDVVAQALKEISPQYNKGRRVNVINQRLSYMVRCGNPDAMDSIVPMAYGNLAMDLINEGVSGRLVNLHNGRYGNVPIEVITEKKKVVDVETYYNIDRLRPNYKQFQSQPLFFMTGE